MVRNEVKQVIDFAQDLNAETFDYSRIGFSRFFKTGWFFFLTMWGEAYEVCRNLHKNFFPDGQFEQPVKSLENIDLYLEQHLVIPRITVLAYEETSQI